jgi:hypothetical protein
MIGIYAAVFFGKQRGDVTHDFISVLSEHLVTIIAGKGGKCKGGTCCEGNVCPA